MRLQALRAMAELTTSRLGEVTSYDPANYVARVTLQPDGIKTGWLPIAALWIGNGWGCYAPPSIGNMCSVEFISGDLNAGFVEARFWNNTDRPLSVPSGEFWLVHQTGSCIKFHNDGSVDFGVHTALNVTVGGDVNATVAGKMTASVTGALDVTAASATLRSNLQVNGNIVASGSIKDQNGAKNDMQHIRDQFNAHGHTGVQTGGGTSATPTVTL
jgi:Type VI secretion system/phage-baseplate injector OB domain/GpV Apex motif